MSVLHTTKKLLERDEVEFVFDKLPKEDLEALVEINRTFIGKEVTCVSTTSNISFGKKHIVNRLGTLNKELFYLEGVFSITPYSLRFKEVREAFFKYLELKYSDINENV